MDRLEKFQEMYIANKELDKLFIDLYNHDDFNRKNRLELLVEIGELANETKCFKYWSKKSPNKDLVSEEYADCLMMTLWFFNYHHLELFDIPAKKDDLDVIGVFGKLYQLASKYFYNEDIDTIKNIFVLLIQLGCELEMSDDDIVNAVKRKVQIGKERIKSENA